MSITPKIARGIVVGLLAVIIMAFTAWLAFCAELEPPVVPDPALTPGVARTDITTANVCATKWGKDRRHVTAAMKAEAFKEYGLSGNRDPRCKSKRHFEIDHLISRELGGADDLKNLWPQCYGGTWNAVMKDRLENRLHKEVCAGNITLEGAQEAIRDDWRVPYRTYFGEPK